MEKPHYSRNYGVTQIRNSYTAKHYNPLRYSNDNETRIMPTHTKAKSFTLSKPNFILKQTVKQAYPSAGLLHITLNGNLSRNSRVTGSIDRYMHPAGR